METCLCGAATILVHERIEMKVGPDWSTFVEAEFYRCSTCQEAYFAPGQSDAAQRQAAEVYRQEFGLLSPEQLVQCRGEMSSAQFAKLIGVHPADIDRWERGAVPQPPYIDRAIRAQVKPI